MKTNIGKKTMIIKWRHNNPNQVTNNLNQVSCNNGFTECFIKDTDGKVYANTTAICSGEDNFNKNVGRKISLARALNEINISKTERQQVWHDYDREIGLI